MPSAAWGSGVTRARRWPSWARSAGVGRVRCSVAGSLGLGGGVRNPLFLLTASLLNTGSGSTTPPSRSVLSSSAVQSAFQTLQTDFNNDVTVGSKPTHASVGQLQDDLQSIRKGTLTGTAATTAIQTDEAAILTSLGLTSIAGQPDPVGPPGRPGGDPVGLALPAARPPRRTARPPRRADDHRAAARPPRPAARPPRPDRHPAYDDRLDGPTRQLDDADRRPRARPPELGGSVGVPDAAVGPQERPVRAVRSRRTRRSARSRMI